MKYTALTLLLAAAACSPSAEQDAAAPPASEPLPPMTAPATTTENLAGFVEKVGLANLYEIEAGKIAQQRARSAAVKDFARMTMTDHTAANARLTALLAAEPSPPAMPAGLDQAHLDKLAALRAVEAAKFDELYVDQQVEAHEETLRLLRDYGAAGDTPGVAAFANSLTPTVDAHLNTIRALDAADINEPNKS